MGLQPLILLDTHVLVWWVADAGRLSARANREIRRALRVGQVAASAISLFEISTALRRGRIVLAVPPEQWFADIRLLPELRFEPVTPEIAEAAGSFDDAFPGDPADRIIAATAIALDLRLVSADQRLRQLPRPQTVW